MNLPNERPGPRQAAPELLVLARSEDLCSWLLGETPRWPKRSRFTVTQRLEQHALDLVEELTIARYQRRGRLDRLRHVDLLLERMRRLLRIGIRVQTCDPKTFERALRGIDEIGRMLHGWRHRMEQGHGTTSQ